MCLARRGCRLVLADLDEAELASTRDMLPREAHPSLHRVDVSRIEDVERMRDEALSAHGRVEIVVNNAGVGVAGTFEEQSLEDMQWLFGVNFWGVVHGCKVFLPELRKADEAHIVNISSILGVVGVPMNSSYCASKFAVRGLSESLRAELEGTRIGVTSVHPGGIATNIVAKSRFAPGSSAEQTRERAIEVFKGFMAPEEAAERIVRGIRRNSRRVLITREAHLLDAGQRLSPRATGVLVASAWRRVVERMTR